MKLLYVFTAVLALAVAEETEPNPESIADLEAAAATLELLKEPKETLETSASAYSNTWNDQTSKWANTNSPKGYVPNNNNYPNYYPNKNNYYPNNNNYIPPTNNYVPPTNNYVPPTNNYVPPSNNYVPPSNNYVPPTNNYVPPTNNYVPPTNNYVPPSNNYVPPSNNYIPTNTWTSPAYYPSSTSTTTTPIPIIKNELIYGDNGSYRYEYEIADGTHVGEEGYFTNPKADDESLVKKGWYSYPGPDGKIYTVTYWADHTGFHATGDHLPTPPPIPAAIQAALDQNAKAEAAKAEAEKNKPTQSYYPPPTEKPVYHPPPNNYYPSQPTYYPSQPTYYPSQPTYYPPQNQQTYPQQSGYGK